MPSPPVEPRAGDPSGPGKPHSTPLPTLPQSAFRTLPGPTAALPLADTDPHTPPTSLYIHVPFCFHKCHYCDFYSLVDTRDRQPAFLDRLLHELDALAPRAGRLETIFVGGGTPTLLRPELWSRLLAHLHDRFDLSAAPEFTVECNPETATPELFDILVTGGVNRVSMGAQSFHPKHLKTLERWHDPASVPRALEIARAAGITRRSLDLIYAIPEQTLEEWQADLEAALSMGITHLSAYNLTYEPNTAMTARLGRGEFEPTEEDLEIEMFSRAAERAAANGLARYEVSNYAAPGEECRHNLAYWRQAQWLAAGPSASGHVAGHRWKNAPRLDTYLHGPSATGHAPIIDHEPPHARRALAERLMTGVRLAEGLDGAAMLAMADALHARDELEAVVAEHERHGHLHAADGRWRLTPSGILLADGVASDLMGALGPLGDP